MTRARVIASLAGVVLLAGCSMPTPSVAAKVGDEVIRESTVTQVAGGCAKLLNVEPNTLRADVVRVLMQGAIAGQVAASEKIEISAAAQDEALVQAPQMAALKGDPQCAHVADAYARLQITAKSLGGPEPFLEKSAQLVVEANPRYGVWSPKAFAFVGTGSISQAVLPKK